MRLENVREYKFDPKKVIEGLNGYYESDKRNGYITVYRDFGGPVYLGANVWLSALIEWLRVDHDIFYRPGLILDQVEAARSAAKMCCLRAHIEDETCKRGLWINKNADIPELVDTLFRAYDECSKARDRNRKDATKLSEVTRELRKEVNALKDTVSRVRARLNSKFIPLPGYEDDLEKLADIALRAVEARDETINRLTRTWDIMDYIRKEASRNGFELPDEVDGEPLTIKRVFHDLLELLRKKETEIRNAEWKTRNAVNEQLKIDTVYTFNTLCDILEALDISKSNTAHLDVTGLKTKALQRASVIKSEHDRYQEQLGKATADYQALHKEYQELKSSQKSDVNKLIQDCCVKYNVVAPSRYLSDEASVEYVFSLLDSYSKQRNEACIDRDRAAAILQDLYRDIFDKDCTQYRLQPDEVPLTYEDIANKILDKVLGSVYDYKLKLKNYILHDIKKHGYRYDGLQSKSIEEIVDWIITMATSDHSFVVLKDIYSTVAAPVERLRYNNCDGPTVDHMKDYILKRFEDLQSNKVLETEDLLHKSVDSDRYISDRIRSSCKAHGVEVDTGLLTTSDWRQLVTFLCGEVEKLKNDIEEECKGQAMVTRQETKRECYLYLWNALKSLSPECDALRIDRYEELVDRIFYEMSLINDNCKRCRKEHTTEKLDYIRRANKAEEEVKKLKSSNEHEVENLRSQIDRLKGLINTMNEEVKDM